MKNLQILTFVCTILFQGCGNTVVPTDPCDKSNVICKDTTYIFHSINSADSVIDLCEVRIIGDSLFYGYYCSSLKIIRDHDTLDSLVKWCNTSSPAAHEEMSHLDFCRYTVLAGNIVETCGLSLISTEFKINCPNYTLRIIYKGSGFCQMPSFIPYIYIVPVLPDSISILLHTETYSLVYRDSTKIDTVLKCTSDQRVKEY
jgi:hypothetical protein